MENIVRIYSFVYSHHETQDKCILREVTPPDPLKSPTDG